MMLGVIDGHGWPHGAVLATHVRNHFHGVSAVLNKRLATPMPTSAELVATGAAAGQAVDCMLGRATTDLSTHGHCFVLDCCLSGTLSSACRPIVS